MIAAEYEAIQPYQQTAESTDNELAGEFLLYFASEVLKPLPENKPHCLGAAGEFYVGHMNNDKDDPFYCGAAAGLFPYFI
jgi:hypothetical protein